MARVVARVARCTDWTRTAALLLFCGAFVLLGGSPAPPAPHDRRLVCWQAVMRCHGEAECHYAYDQYLSACAPVLRGGRKTCPSHCISSLLQLNLTRSGPALEDCDCASDPACGRTQRAIEPCLPRVSTLGCTEARTRCEGDAPCSAAMSDYMLHCRRLFGARGSCSDQCRRVISKMRAVPRAKRLETCVCDGADRTICEFIKASMRTLCFDGEGGSGTWGDSEEDSGGDEYFESVDYSYVDGSSSGGESLPGPGVLLTVATTILAFFFVIEQSYLRSC